MRDAVEREMVVEDMWRDGGGTWNDMVSLSKKVAGTGWWT